MPTGGDAGAGGVVTAQTERLTDNRLRTLLADFVFVEKHHKSSRPPILTLAVVSEVVNALAELQVRRAGDGVVS